MEAKPVTIEIRRDTAIMLTVIAAGVLLVGGTFYYVYDPIDHWSMINVTGCVAGAYCIGLVVFMMRPPVPAKYRWWTLGIVAVIAAIMTLGWTKMQDQSLWQRNLLLSIRTTIGKGILLAEVPDTLQNVLAAHYQQVDPRPTGIGASFRKVYPNARVGSDIRFHHYDQDSGAAIVQEISDTLVTVIGIDPVARGKDPTFKMYNGRIGGLQIRFRLNYQGVTYEREN